MTKLPGLQKGGVPVLLSGLSRRRGAGVGVDDRRATPIGGCD